MELLLRVYFLEGILFHNMKGKIKNIINHPLFSGSAIMFVGNMGANVINYGYHIIMGRLLGPLDYGVLASLYSIIYLISIIPSSASVSIVKFISTANEDELPSVYYSIKKFIFKLAIVLSLFMLAISPFVAKFLKIESLSSVLLITPILFLALITLVNQSSSQGLLKFSGSVIPTFISSALKLLIGVGLVLIGWSVSGAMLAIAIGLLFAYLNSQKFIDKYIKQTSFKRINLNSFVKYSGPVVIQSLAFTSIFTIDVLLVKHFLDPFSAGIYAALSTLGKIIFFATSPIASTMFPIIAKRKAAKEKYINVFLIAILTTSLIAVGITVFYWLFPNIAIGVLFGKDYLSARTDLIWMGIFMTFYSLSNLVVNFYLSIGNTKVVYIPLLAAIAQIVSIWFYHNSITQVLHSSLYVTAGMFLCLVTFTGYNLFAENRK